MSTETLELVSDNFEPVEESKIDVVKSTTKPSKKSTRYAHKNVLYLTLILAVIVVSIYWTHAVLTNEQNSSQYTQTMLQQISQYELEKSLLQDKLSAFNTEDASAQKNMAEATVFNGYLELADWLHSLNELSEQYGLQMEYQLFETKQVNELGDIHVVPMQMSIGSTVSQNYDSNYKKFMTFMQVLVNDNKYKRFTSAGIENQGEAGARLSLDIEIRKRKDMLVANKTQ